MNRKPIIRSEEWRRNVAEGVRRAWAEGKYANNRPDYKAIAEKNRGRKRPEAACQATREGVKKAWEIGKYHTPEAIESRRKHLSKVHATNKGASPEFMDEIRARRNMDELKKKNSEKLKQQIEKWKATGDIHRIRLAQRKALLGKHGFGRGARGRLDHNAAKFWVIRDPVGRVFEFSNLCEWVRQNIHRFEDKRPDSKLPLVHRVAHGIANLGNGRKARLSTHYFGWTLVSVSELNGGASDLLGRDEALDPTKDADGLSCAAVNMEEKRTALDHTIG